MIKLITTWFKAKILRRKPKRLEMKLVRYDVADKMMKRQPGVWTIAKDEDTNFIKSFVYIERLSYDE
jgi:hypothetical protein